MSEPVFQFGDFELNCGRFQLLRKGQPLPVERKPLELLILLVSREGNLVTRREIVERLWTSAVFVDTDHSINTAIRKLRYLLRDDPESPKFIETVTGMGYRFAAPVTTVEEHSSGIAAAPAPPIPSQGDQSIEPEPRVSMKAGLPRLLWIVLAVSVTALIAVLVFTLGPHPLAARLFHRGSIQPAITSIAILPLNNLSGDPNQDYFADGITDELITMLARDSTLRITSRTSVMQYKDARRPLREIARALNVDGILEGSVSRSNNQVHMTLQLIRADTDTHVWADSYDRDANDVAALPDDAARAIAARLNSSTPPHAPAHYINPEAHDAYLRGHYDWVVGRNEDAGKYFRQAIQIQPDYALAWTGLSSYYAMGALNGDVDPLQAMPQAEAAARKALELDDSLALAHGVFGGMAFLNRGDGVLALKELTRSSELDPNDAEIYHLHAKVLCALGRNDEAIAIQKQSTAINPFEHPGAMAEIYLCTRHFDDAIRDGEMRLKDFPVAPDILFVLADSYHWKGQDKEATEMFARGMSAIGDASFAAAVRHVFETGGYPAVVRYRLADLEKTARTGRVSTFQLAELHGMLGEHDQTLALLEQGVDERDPLMRFLVGSDPAFDFLHTDPRYRSVIQHMGLPSLY